MAGVERDLHKAHGGDCHDVVDSCSEGQMGERGTVVPKHRTQDRGLGRSPSQGQLVIECSEVASADKGRSYLQKDKHKDKTIDTHVHIVQSQDRH